MSEYEDREELQYDAEVSVPEETQEHEVGLPDKFIAEIVELLKENYTDRIQELCRELSAPDTAELLTKIKPEESLKLAEILGDEIDPETFPYLDRELLNHLFEHMPRPQIASIVNRLESDDAISLIHDLPEEQRQGIMHSLSRRVRAAVEEGLTFPEKTAGRLMQREFVAIPQFWTVGKTVDFLRAAADALPKKFYDLFIVDPMHRFVGAVGLSETLCSQRAVKIDSLMSEEHVTIPVDMDQHDIAILFRRKDLLSAPVIDENNRLIGVIAVDDVVDIIDEEAEEDFLKAGGVTNSDIFRPTMATARSRFWWLAVNLFTAIAASAVIRAFETSIEKVVALAVLMPIVASMGGNAGTQTLTVAIRALATKELTAANAWRVVGKEFMVGIINGLAFAVLMMVAVYIVFQDLRLGLVMAAAMIVNLIAAGLAGALIPLAMHRLDMDPAPSSGVFLTTVTDVVGFFAFLGLATAFLL